MFIFKSHHGLGIVLLVAFRSASEDHFTIHHVLMRCNYIACWCSVLYMLLLLPWHQISRGLRRQAMEHSALHGARRLLVMMHEFTTDGSHRWGLRLGRHVGLVVRPRRRRFSLFVRSWCWIQWPSLLALSSALAWVRRLVQLNDCILLGLHSDLLNDPLVVLTVLIPYVPRYVLPWPRWKHELAMLLLFSTYLTLSLINWMAHLNRDAPIFRKSGQSVGYVGLAHRR